MIKTEAITQTKVVGHTHTITVSDRELVILAYLVAHSPSSWAPDDSLYRELRDAWFRLGTHVTAQSLPVLHIQPWGAGRTRQEVYEQLQQLSDRRE